MFVRDGTVDQRLTSDEWTIHTQTIARRPDLAAPPQPSRLRRVDDAALCKKARHLGAGLSRVAVSSC
jgi:hypothetical protein